MEFIGKIAEITIELGVKRVITLNFSEVHIRFRCQRCAVFCCELGAPKLLTSDIERLKQAGYSPQLFLDDKMASLKSKKDGSCIFLSFNAEKSLRQCSVYNYRPTFCKLYPFRFEKSGRQCYRLNLIPCCNGLNVQNGEQVDEEFFVKHLQQILLDLIDSNAI